MQTQNSAPSPTSGGTNLVSGTAQNGPTGLSALAAAVVQLESPGAQEASVPTTPGALPDPDKAQTDVAPEPGQNLPSENNEPNPEPDGEGNESTDLLNNSSDEGAAFAGLDESTRDHAIKIAKAIAAGELEAGTLPRIDKLIAQKHEAQETIERLSAELEEARANPTAMTSPTSKLPEPVAKLKTAAELNKTEMDLKRFTMWAQRNPNGGSFNGVEFTPENIGQAWEGADEMLLAIPQRREELQKEAAFKVNQQQQRAQTYADFPVLKDEAHPETKTVRQLLKDPRFSGVENAEYLALAMARGHAVLQAEKAAKAKPAPRPAATANGVPKGKPATNGGGGGAVSARNSGAAANIESAKSRIKTEGSVGSLAALVSANETR